jgi:hypothetical protein
MAGALTGMTGLTGMYGPEVPYGQEGRDPREFGTGPDPSHHTPGDSSAQGHDYEGTRYPVVVDHDDEVESTPPPGEVADRTPDSHAAPYPVGLTHDPLIAAEQMRVLHGLDLGAADPIARGVGLQYPVVLDTAFENSPNTTVLATGVPAQLRTGHDIDQGRGWDPGFGFAFGHLLRRVFKDAVPIDRTGTVHGERPFWGAHPVAQARFDGPDSPYGESGDTSQGMKLAPTRVGYATPYLQPPNPTMSPTTQYDDEAAFAGGWMAG